MLKKKSSVSQSKRRATEINIGEHRRKVLKKANNVDHYYLDVLDSQEKMYDDLLQTISERRNKIISQEIRNKRFNDKFQRLEKAEMADEILQEWKKLREKILHHQKKKSSEDQSDIEPYEEKQLKAMEKIILNARNNVLIKKTSSTFNWFKAIASSIFTVGSGVSLLFSVQDVMSPWQDGPNEKEEWNKIMAEVNAGIREYEASTEMAVMKGFANSANTVGRVAAGGISMVSTGLTAAAKGVGLIQQPLETETTSSPEANPTLTVNKDGIIDPIFDPRSINLIDVPEIFPKLRKAIQRRDTYLAADAYKKSLQQMMNELEISSQVQTVAYKKYVSGQLVFCKKSYGVAAELVEESPSKKYRIVKIMNGDTPKLQVEPNIGDYQWVRWVMDKLMDSKTKQKVKGAIFHKKDHNYVKTANNKDFLLDSEDIHITSIQTKELVPEEDGMSSKVAEVFVKALQSHLSLIHI